MRISKRFKRAKEAISAPLEHKYSNIFDHGRNKYRNRGLARSAFAIAALMPTADYVLGNGSLPGLLVALSLCFSVDQGIVARGNFSGKYKKYSHRTHIGFDSMGYFKSRWIALKPEF